MEEWPKGKATRCARPLCTVESAVRIVQRIEGPVVRVAQQGEPVVRPAGLPQLVRKPGDSTGYALAPEIDGDLLELELVSDGTGGGRTAGLAWASTWSVGQEGGEEGVEEVRGTGWVPGEAGSDRSELGGLVQMLREVCRVARGRRAAGKRLRVARLVTDCEGARDAAEWAVSAPMGKVLTHKNRVLLLEWRGRMREAVELGVQVSIGWMKGHTDRTDWPYPVQAWCDEFAVAANAGGEDVEGEARWLSQWEAPFVLWDEREQRPVWSGWNQELARRLRAEAASRARGSDSLAAEWMRLRASGFTAESEWDGRALGGKHRPEARGRLAAQWDVVFGPGRWEQEQKARELGALDEHRWQCLTCGEEAAGAWAAHATGECRGTEEARAYVDGVAGVELMRQLAYDPALVQRVWGRWKDTWRAMLRGQAWQGFTGREGVRLPGDGAVPRVGVGARDGEPAVFSREEQAEAQRRWKKEFGGTKVEGSGPPAGWTWRATAMACQSCR